VLLNRNPLVLGYPNESFQGTQIGDPIAQLPMPIAPFLVSNGWEMTFSEKAGFFTNDVFPV